MANPYLGEIRMFAGNFAPVGWAMCNGQILPITQNTALFSLLGTTYGGNGQTNFALPDLRSRVPMHFGQGVGLSPYVLGEVTGTETVTLNTTQIPGHNHSVSCSSAGGTQANPTNGFIAVESTGTSLDFATTTNAVMNPGMIQNAGGSQPHNNIQPILCLNFIIALQGIYPSRN